MPLARRVLLVLLAALVAVVVPVLADAPIVGDETVYLTRTGPKFHSQACSSLRYVEPALKLRDASPSRLERARCTTMTSPARDAKEPMRFL